MHLLRSLPLLLLCAALASAGPDPLPRPADPEVEISGERALLLSEIATSLQQGAASQQDLTALASRVSGAIQAVPSVGASPIVLSSSQRQDLALLVQAAIQGDQAALARLDSFPGWTTPQLGQVLRGELSAGTTAPVTPARPTSISEELGIPVADQTPPSSKLEDLGHGIYRGDVYDTEKAKRYPDSRRLAEVMNRLSLNGTGWVLYKGQAARSPRGLLELLRSDGHTLEAKDHRSIANFSGLYYRGAGASAYREIVAPLWLDSRIPVPGSSRTLLVPATHSELVISVRGPVVNADLAFYLGIDSLATFRASAWRRPSWTGSRSIRTFSGSQALDAVSAAAWVRRGLTHLTDARGLMSLRSKAYGQLGVCNDATALIEGRLGLEASHWPLIRLPELYRDAGSLTQVSDALPYDVDPAVIPSRQRVIDSVPFRAGEVPALFPTLAADLDAIAADDAAKAAASSGAAVVPDSRGAAGAANDALGD